MKLLKFTTVLATCCAMLMCSITQVSASTTAVRFIDNDTNVSGYRNNRYGFNEYISSSSLYYSDARITNSSNSNNSYYYIFPNIGTENQNLSITLKAYLNHARFTDRKAKYFIKVNIDDVYYPVDTIDQNSASAGWNPIYANFNRNYQIRGAFSVSQVILGPSGNSGYETGADAVYVEAVY